MTQINIGTLDRGKLLFVIIFEFSFARVQLTSLGINNYANSTSTSCRRYVLSR